MQARRAIGVSLMVCLALSVLAHLGVIGGGLIRLGATPPLREPPVPEPIIGDTITPGEAARIRQGVRTAKLDEAQAKDVVKPDEAKKETPKPKPVAAIAPPPPEPPPPPKEEPKPPEPVKVAEPPPKPAEASDKQALEEKLAEVAEQQALEDKRRAEAAAAQAKVDAAAKAKALAEIRAKAVAKAKADAKEKADKLAKENSKADREKLAALLDKSPNPKEAPAAAPQPTAPTKAKGPVKGAADGRDAANAANEASLLLGMIVGKVKTCWNIQAGGEGASQLVPVIRFELNRDGSVRGAPRVMNPQASPQFQAAADAAMRAVIGCQNYALPVDKYDKWKLVTLEFDPSEMFR